MKKILLSILLFAGYTASAQNATTTEQSKQEVKGKVTVQPAPKREVKVAKIDATKQDPEVKPKADRKKD